MEHIQPPDKHVFLRLIADGYLLNDWIAYKGFSFRTEDSLYAPAVSNEVTCFSGSQL